MELRIHYNEAVARALMALERSSRARTLTMERLSSGRRINRAADDAAGLAIAERLKARIRGLNQAVRNVQMASRHYRKLTVTWDGGMGQMQEIVHRLRELSVRAAGDTLTWRDRLHIQEEVDQLTAELYAITQRTEFNGRKVLVGAGGDTGEGDGLKYAYL